MKGYVILSFAVVAVLVSVTQAEIVRRFQTYTRVLLQVEHLMKPDPNGTADLERELVHRGVNYDAVLRRQPLTDFKDVPEQYRPAFTFPWCRLKLLKAPKDVLPLIRDIPITHLSLDQSSIVDLAPVNEMPLIELSIRATRISDLSPVKGKMLYAVDFRESKVTDISPLEGMPLELLDLSFTEVSDISPIERIRSLETLFLSYCGVTDITVVAKTKLKYLYLPDTITAGLDLLRENRTVTHIGYGDSEFLPVDEFWKKFDDGQLKPSRPMWKPKAKERTEPPHRDQQPVPLEGER